MWYETAVNNAQMRVVYSALYRYLRAPVCKNQTKAKFRGEGGKFDFFHILMLDRLGYN